MFKLYRYLFPGVLAFVLGFRLGTVLLLIRPAPLFDEPIHLQVVQQFGPGLPAIFQLRDYPSATGPFFYVLFGNLGALLGYDLTMLRVAVYALALGNILLFYRILRRLLPAKSPMPAVTLLATAPYFAALAGVFMTEHLALFLGLAALLCYLRFRDAGRPLDALLALLFATLAVYTRVYYAFLPLAFATTTLFCRGTSSLITAPSSFLTPRSSLLASRSSLLSSFLASHSSLITHRSSLLSSLLWLLPVVAFLPMVFLWRGFAPPFFQYVYHPAFSWQNTSSVLLWSGIIFLPWVWHELKPWHLVCLLAIPAIRLAPLPGLGITRSALKLLPHPFALVVACLLGIIGLLWFIRLAPLALKSGTRVAAIGSLALVAGLLVSGPAVFERYLLPGIPLMLICARPGTRPKLALAWAALFQLPLALAHILRLAA